MRYFKIVEMTDEYIEAVNIDDEEEGMVLTSASKKILYRYENFKLNNYIVFSPDNVISVMTAEEFEIIKRRRENHLILSPSPLQVTCGNAFD